MQESEGDKRRDEEIEALQAIYCDGVLEVDRMGAGGVALTFRVRAQHSMFCDGVPHTPITLSHKQEHIRMLKYADQNMIPTCPPMLACSPAAAG